MKKTFNLLAVLVPMVLITSIYGCKKNNTNEPEVGVTAIVPTSGPYSTIVTITGSNFSATAAENTVTFNGVAAVVQSATATQIVAVVPKAAGTGPVAVKRGTKTGTGPIFNFVYTITASTYAGSIAGYANGSLSSAQFAHPSGLCIDASGNMYVVDRSNLRIRKITSAGVVSTFAGDGTPGAVNGNGASASFLGPWGICADATGNLYVGDFSNNLVRKITPSGVVSTLAGDGIVGHADGNGTAAEFNGPGAPALDGNGNVYVPDFSSHYIRKITPANVVSTVAGTGVAGFANGSGASAQFNNPLGVAFDAQNNMYVADRANCMIRKITPAGVVSTLAGTGVPGHTDGDGATAQFNSPGSLCVDAQGNIYVAEQTGNYIRKITPAGIVSTIAGNGTPGFVNGNGSSASFSGPAAIAIDASGNLFVADEQNGVIRKITVE